MAYVSLYRRYRPNEFSSMIGQQHIIRTLRNQIMTGAISHAYLFTGSRGLPEAIAIALVAALHLWKRQMLLSIAGGTVCYMLLVQLVF